VSMPHLFLCEAENGGEELSEVHITSWSMINRNMLRPCRMFPASASSTTLTSKFSLISLSSCEHLEGVVCQCLD
jgi:hypothetical protein